MRWYIDRPVWMRTKNVYTYILSSSQKVMVPFLKKKALDLLEIIQSSWKSNKLYFSKSAIF
jgi:hypothetical protein